MKNRRQNVTKKNNERVNLLNKSLNWGDIKKGESIQRQIVMHSV